MTKRPGLSKGEMDVARTLWDMGSATVRQLHEVLEKEKSIDFSTVQTYLRRLEQKGYAKTKLDGRVRVYSPSVKAETVIRETVGDLVDRLFGGNSMPLMQHLIEDNDVSSDEIAQLKSLISKLEKSQKSRPSKSPNKTKKG